MMPTDLLLEPGRLTDFLASCAHPVRSDVGSSENYFKHHLPSAVFFDYRHLILGQPPAPGKLPVTELLSRALAESGIDRDKTVIAYADEGGGKASRLLWTLDLLGFEHLHLVNGGLHAWAQEKLPVEDGSSSAIASSPVNLEFNQAKIADKAFILANLDNPEVLIWDVRTTEEYAGTRPRARRNGHIPGAVNLDWMSTIDRDNGLRYLPDETLVNLLKSKGITVDKTIIPHCHTHHRSAHSAILLKYLGYPNVQASPGSWSEWGNAEDTPVEH